MADSGLEKLFADLDAAFEASLAREEEAAASDLAFALAQTNTFQDVVRRKPHRVVLLGEHFASPVIEVGSDYVATDPPVRFIPSGLAILRVDDTGDPPSATDATLLLTMRRLARGRASVEVACRSSCYAGVLSSVAPDHLVLRGATGELFIGMKAVCAIRLLSDPGPLGL